MYPTEIDDLKVISSRLQPVLTQASLAEERMKPTGKMVQDVVAQILGVLDELSVGEKTWNKEFEQVKKKWEWFLEEGNEYMIKKEKLEKLLIEQEVATRVMTRTPLNL